MKSLERSFGLRPELAVRNVGRINRVSVREHTREISEFGSGYHPCKIDVVSVCSCGLAKLP